MSQKKGKFVWVIELLLLIAVVFFGYSIVTALDRNRQEMAQLRLALSSFTGSNSVPALQSAAAVSGPPCELSSYYDKNARYGGTVETAIPSDVASLNMITGNEATASSIIAMCTSTLGTRDFEHPEIFVPLIAESWQVSPDGKRINVKLRQGVLWHDFTDPESGKYVSCQPVTAHDFVFYVNVVNDPKVNAGALRSYFQDLESIQAISDYELEVVWKNEYYRSLEMTLSLSPLPRHFYCPDGQEFDPEKFNYDHKRNDMIVGCGPYKLVEHVKDQRFVLKRFDRYFGNALGIAPSVETRVLQVVKADNTRFQMLLSNELSILSVSPEQWVKRTGTQPFSAKVLSRGERAADFPLAAGERFRRVKNPANAYSYIGYNLRNELFADRRVRQALTMLCNRQKILEDVYFNQGRIISGPFFCDSPYYDQSIAPWPFDPARAKALLAQAGWVDSNNDGILDRNGKNFVFTALQVSGNPMQERILSIFKEDLASAGIDMKIIALEWPVYISKLEERDFEVCSLGWSIPFESDPYQVWHSSQAEGSNGSNHVGFINAEADRIIEEIRKTFDVTKRIELCHEFHRIIHEEQPYTFLMVPEQLSILSGDLENVRCFPLGLESDTFWINRPTQ